MDDEIVCIYAHNGIGGCENYPEKCSQCRMNQNLKTYLKIKKEDKTLVVLEK